MDAKQFFDKVARMREAQQLYFKTRSQSYLKESKRLEREIDDEIERVNDIQRKKQNPNLFSNE